MGGITVRCGLRKVRLGDAEATRSPHAYVVLVVVVGGVGGSPPVQQLGVFLAHLTQPCQPSPEGAPGRPAHRHFRDPMAC
jgi:hypothetical protein